MATSRLAEGRQRSLPEPPLRGLGSVKKSDGAGPTTGGVGQTDDPWDIGGNDGINEVAKAIRSGHAAGLDQMLVQANVSPDDIMTMLELAIVLRKHGCVEVLQSIPATQSDPGAIAITAGQRTDRLLERMQALQVAVRCAAAVTFEAEDAGPDSDVNVAESDLERAARHCLAAEAILRHWYAALERTPGPPKPIECGIAAASGTSLKVTVADSEALLYRMGVLYIRLEWWDVAAPDDPRPHRILNTRFGEVVIDGLAEGHEYAVEATGYNLAGFGPSAPSRPVSTVLRQTAKAYPGFQDLVTAAFTAVFSKLATAFTREPEPVIRHVKPKASGSIKFKGNLRSGVYIALVFCSRENGEVWTYDKVYVPTVLIDNESKKEALDDLAWVQHVATGWQQLPDPATFQHSDAISKMRWRKEFVSAAAKLQSAIGVTDLGSFWGAPVVLASNKAVVLPFCRVISQAEVHKRHRSLGWIAPATFTAAVAAASVKLSDEKPFPTEVAALVPTATAMLTNPAKLDPGLYVAALHPVSTLGGVLIEVPVIAQHMLPVERIRENGRLDDAEFELLVTTTANGKRQKPAIVTQVLTAARKLLHRLGIDDGLAEWRLYPEKVIKLNDFVSIVLVLPPADGFLGLTGETPAPRNDGVILLGQKQLESRIASVYHPNYAEYAQLMRVLSTSEVLAKHALKSAFTTTETTAAEGRDTAVAEQMVKLGEAWAATALFQDALRWGKAHRKATFTCGGNPDSTLALLGSTAGSVGTAPEARTGRGKRALPLPPTIPGHSAYKGTAGSSYMTHHTPGHIFVYIDPDCRAELMVPVNIADARASVAEVVELVNETVEFWPGMEDADVEEFHGLALVIGDDERDLDDSVCPRMLHNIRRAEFESGEHRFVAK